MPDVFSKNVINYPEGPTNEGYLLDAIYGGEKPDVKTEKRKILNKISRWTNGRNVTKEKLREFLNKLRLENK